MSSISLLQLPSYAIGSDKVLHRLFQRCQLQCSGNAPLPKAQSLATGGSVPGGSELKMMSSASFLEPLSTPATAYQHPPSLHSAFTWFFAQMERQNRSSPNRPSSCSEVGGAGALCSSQGDEEEAPGHPALWGVTRPPGSRVARREGWGSSEMK